MTLSVTPLTPRTRRSTTIAAEIRQLILSKQLKPGDKLPTEEALCAQFGVSRTTLREAIQTLRTTGLLDVTPGRGSFIRLPDLSHLMNDIMLSARSGIVPSQEVSHLRYILQKDMMNGIARSSASKRKDLYKYVLARNAAPEENAQTETQWHLELAELAGNSLSKLMLESLLMLEQEDRIRHFRDLDNVMRTIHIQMRVNAALTDADWPLAERVLCQYINPALPQAPNGALTSPHAIA